MGNSEENIFRAALQIRLFLIAPSKTTKRCIKLFSSAIFNILIETIIVTMYTPQKYTHQDLL